MSLIVPSETAVVRAAEAETLGGEGFPSTARLLLDSSSTNDALSLVRITLAEGANGATPHRHSTASELFYVLGGEVQVLADDKVLTLGEGDAAVVPPEVAHAFAATPGSGADLLIVITPGVERFGYFRLLAKVALGQADLQELLAAQDKYDNHFLDSPAWTAARA